MPADPSFTELMERLRTGDQHAAARVFEEYAGRLVALARARLGAALRSKVDPEDVMQSAFKSFFLRQTTGQWRLENWDSLWGLLAQITVRKCGHRVEYFHAACRNIDRETGRSSASDDSTVEWEAAARDPTPEEAAILAETVERLMKELGSRDRQILALTLQGYGIRDLSATLGCTERTVYRVHVFLRSRLLALRDSDQA
jgi:RNA polymerase sigma-70 factor (ECF subfamily)